MSMDRSDELGRELKRLRQGDHLCHFYETATAVEAMVVPFFQDGLARNERCLFIADDANAHQTTQMLARAGVDAKREIERGALRILTTREAYLPAGRFEPLAMLEKLERETDDALAAGFSGLRGSGDMAWVLGPHAGTDQLIMYEAVLNDVASRRQFLGVCRYDLRLFPPSLLQDVLRVHPSVVIGSLVCPSAYYEPPRMALGEAGDDERLRWTIGQLHRTRAAKLELERALEVRDQALRARDEFLSVAAHELRTPLTTLSLQLQRMAREIERRSFDGLEHMAKEAIKASRHLNALVENMLDVTHVAAGRTEFVLHQEPVDLVGVTRDVAERFRGASAIEITAAEPVVGHWDRVRIEEVVTNLLSNACKYGRGQPIDVVIERRAGSASLTVRDRGIGIDEQDLARIFEPFERAVSNDSYGGLGVGLFITRKIVEAHGGTLSVESERDKGSTFTINLPVEASV